MAVQDIIKSRRKYLQLTLKDVADKLGVSEGTVSRYESGDIQNMGIDKIAALAKVLKCSPGYLMGWEQDPEGQPEEFSLLEREIIYRYRTAPEGIKESVCKLLDVKAEEKRDASGTSADMLA